MGATKKTLDTDGKICICIPEMKKERKDCVKKGTVVVKLFPMGGLLVAFAF